jgi:hypothetical protein
MLWVSTEGPNQNSLVSAGVVKRRNKELQIKLEMCERTAFHYDRSFEGGKRGSQSFGFLSLLRMCH